MGISFSKNKYFNIQINLFYPKKIHLKFVESNNSGPNSKYYKFKIPKNKRFIEDIISLKISFIKTSQILTNIKLNENLKKNIHKNKKIYYDSKHIPLEYGHLILRLDKNLKLAYLIIDITNNKLNLLSK
jgi:hypothetical protein